MGEDKTRIIFDYYYADRVTEELIKEDLRFSDEVQQEDIEICELVQRGLRSRSYHTGRFSVEREIAVHHFQSLLKQSLKN
jgi:choline monooxygenase